MEYSRQPSLLAVATRSTKATVQISTTSENTDERTRKENRTEETEIHNIDPPTPTTARTEDAGW